MDKNSDDFFLFRMCIFMNIERCSNQEVQSYPVIGIPCNVSSQREWWSAPRSEAGLGELEVRMVSDTTGAVATKYGVFKQNECVAFRLSIFYCP